MADPENSPAGSPDGRKAPPGIRRSPDSYLVHASNHSSIARAVQWLLHEKREPTGQAAAWKGTEVDGKVDFALVFDGQLRSWRIEPAATLFEVLHRELGFRAKRVSIHGNWIDPRLTRAIIWNGCAVSSEPAEDGAGDAA